MDQFVSGISSFKLPSKRAYLLATNSRFDGPHSSVCRFEVERQHVDILSVDRPRVWSSSSSAAPTTRRENLVHLPLMKRVVNSKIEPLHVRCQSLQYGSVVA